MNILLLATRSPWGRTTGRKVVLRTIISSLRAIGHNVTVVVFQKHGAETFSKEEYLSLPLPGAFRILWNVLFYFLRSKLSLNECLFFSPRNVSKLHEICKQLDTDIIIADMIRTAPYAVTLELPWILDLDDLLSKRYRDMVDQNLPTEMLLGYFSEYVPTMFRALFFRFIKIFLAKEASLISEREIFLSGKANVVCLVSNDEAQEFSRRTNKRVLSMPMAVEIKESSPVNILKRPASLVFMGGLDYQPNLAAVRFFLNHIVPAFRSAENKNIVLNVIGFCPTSVRDELQSQHLNFLGYIEDLTTELHKHQLFLAPIISGTGIKTKVLEAMAAGLPVLSSPQGVKGLNVEGGKECYIAHSPDEYVKLLQFIEANPEIAAQTAAEGKRFVTENYSSQALALRWKEAIRSI